MAGTRIVVLQSRKVIYSMILLGLSVLAIVLLVMMFVSGKDKNGETASVLNEIEQEYEAGVYTKEIQIGDTMVNLQLSLDENNVKSVELVNLDESVETMYPLMQPTVEKISKQLAAGKSMEEIVISEESQYTEKLIVQSVSEMMQEHKK